MLGSILKQLLRGIRVLPEANLPANEVIYFLYTLNYTRNCFETFETDSAT